MCISPSPLTCLSHALPTDPKLPHGETVSRDAHRARALCPTNPRAPPACSRTLNVQLNWYDGKLYLIRVHRQVRTYLSQLPLALCYDYAVRQHACCYCASRCVCIPALMTGFHVAGY